MSSDVPLFIIPVRGGSKGLPGKNKALVEHIPLIGRAVRAAKAAARQLGGHVVVDSDDAELRALGLRWGADDVIERPAELATDTTASMAVIAACLRTLAVPDQQPVVLVQATVPFIDVDHICACVQRWHREPAGAVVSVIDSGVLLEHCYRFSVGSDQLVPVDRAEVARRQECESIWRLSGGVYVAAARQLRENCHFIEHVPLRGVVAPARMAVDIDTSDDLVVARAMTEDAADVCLGDRRIGSDAPAYIIAEIGVNHDGDPQRAHRLIDLAADCGADAVKFQTWVTERICRPDACQAAYQAVNTGKKQSQFAMLKELELPRSCYADLMAHCDERGVEFLSTPDEDDSAAFLVESGMRLIKVGSGEVDNLPYLAHLAGYGLPILLSTGMADLIEVARAVDILVEHGAPALGLFHAVSDYPAAPDQMNVRALVTLREAFKVPVGLSDHCLAVEPALAAVGLGMSIWEKHVTDDRTRSGPDHRASLDGTMLASQIAAVRAAESALGTGVKSPTSAELSTRTVVRRRGYLSRPVAAGEMLTWDMVAALRGGDGSGMAELAGFLGRVFKTAQPADVAISGDLFV